MQKSANASSKTILQNQADALKQTKNILLLCEKNTEYDPLKDSLQKSGYRVFLLPKNAKGLEATLGRFAIDAVLIPIDDSSTSISLRIGRFLHRLGTLPYLYLSTSTDDALMVKAQKTYPYGYHVYPLDTINLYTSIECACHCFAKNKEYKASVRKFKSEYDTLKKQAFNVRSNQSILKICDCFSFQIKDFSLRFQNQNVHMTKKERALISLLVSQLGSIVNFDQIIDYVWKDADRIQLGGEIVTHHDVRTLIWRFNKKLPVPLIQNASGIGYFIEA